MPVDPQLAGLLELVDQLEPPRARELTVEQNRAQFARVVGRDAGLHVFEATASSDDVAVPGPAGDLACRLHRPTGVPVPPVLVYLHGGGWILGGTESHEAVARALCRRAGVAVLAVDYRLAPEHPYPAALEDSVAVTRWVSQQAGRLGLGAVGVGGDSAGGNLAAAVALACRDEGPPLAVQLLVYPALDATASSPSYVSNGTGYFLEAEDMRWYWQQYAQDADRGDPLLSPSAAPDLTGLPPAVVVTAEYDVLRDEGDDYAARLRAAGVDVWSRCFPGLTHGFLGSGGYVPAADRALTELAEQTGRVLRRIRP